MTGTRARRRHEIEQQILQLGRRQLAESGAAALSLRAVARELNMVSSAVYRYVESRDELLTRLVVAAYDDLADTVDEQLAATTADPAERLAAAATAVRSWAVAHPAEFSLLYGSPVPGYHAPAERTGGPGTRVIGVLLRTLADAENTAATSTAGPTTASPTTANLGPAPDAPLAGELQAVADEFGAALSPAAAMRAIAFWGWLIGAVGLEVAGGYGADTFSDPQAVFQAQLSGQLAALLGSGPDGAASATEPTGGATGTAAGRRRPS